MSPPEAQVRSLTNCECLAPRIETIALTAPQPSLGRVVGTSVFGIACIGESCHATRSYLDMHGVRVTLPDSGSETQFNTTRSAEGTENPRDCLCREFSLPNLNPAEFPRSVSRDPAEPGTIVLLRKHVVLGHLAPSERSMNSPERSDTGLLLRLLLNHLQWCGIWIVVSQPWPSVFLLEGLTSLCTLGLRELRRPPRAAPSLTTLD